MAKMLQTSFTTSTSLSLPIQRNNHRFNRISNPFIRSKSSSSISFPSKIARFSPSICSSSSYLQSWKPVSWMSNRSPDFEVKATSVSDSGGEEESDATATAAAVVAKSKMAETAVLGLLFGIWYLFNIYFNIYNKQILQVFPNPVTLTAVQLAVGTAMIFFSWALNLHKWPNISRAQLVAILPLAVMHTLGNLSTNMSLGKVSVSFTHTIKAMEPFFTVVLSNMFLGEIPTPWVVSSLVPIVGGVVLASLTEGWLFSAMTSNLANQSRNVLSKKFMVKKEESLDNITLFSIITIMSFLMFTPVALLVEGVKFTPSYLQSAGLNLKHVYVRTLLASIFFHTYQQVAYMILQRVSPVTHSVGNCVKRVVVIVSSIFFFRHPSHSSTP
ncbi:hypothetical protein OSB04_004891 [Centaurea solstitialis]|uniref:Sugar phosphate transporter domain-containing protein n=1 Tax=Centaurea solstitialis TaxID=347529 RepID=A0AA38WRS5_9ASTR|nr:hypothetical protein OSB04_004891 [Centaurea solstitialis]